MITLNFGIVSDTAVTAYAFSNCKMLQYSFSDVLLEMFTIRVLSDNDAVDAGC